MPLKFAFCTVFRVEHPIDVVWITGHGDPLLTSMGWAPTSLAWLGAKAAPCVPQVGLLDYTLLTFKWCNPMRVSVHGALQPVLRA